MLIEDFVEDGAHRLGGLGTVMLKYLEGVVKRKGCTGLVHHTGKHNLIAQKFYRKHGLEENVMYKLDIRKSLTLLNILF